MRLQPILSLNKVHYHVTMNSLIAAASNQRRALSFDSTKRRTSAHPSRARSTSDERTTIIAVELKPAIDISSRILRSERSNHGRPAGIVIVQCRTQDPIQHHWGCERAIGYFGECELRYNVTGQRFEILMLVYRSNSLDTMRLLH